MIVVVTLRELIGLGLVTLISIVLIIAWLRDKRRARRKKDES